jgi:membrane fusion protein (multidrug efflux system)
MPDRRLSVATLSHPRPATVLGALLALALLGGGLSGCDGSKAATGPKADATPPVAVETVQPVRADMAAVYSGTAPIEADQESKVVAKVGGEVRRLLVEEGDRVRAGQVLAVLDGDKLRLEVAEAKANLAKLERDFQRNLELQKRGLIGSAAFDDLRYQLDAERAVHDLAALQLSYTEIRAPIDGVVAERKVKVGNTLMPNDPLFTITKPEPLIAHVHVPERELAKLAVGQQAEVQVDAAGGVYPAHIRRISPVVDPATGTFKVTLEFAPAPQLRAGMFSRVNIVYERRAMALQIPRAALLEADSGPTVFVVAGGKAQSRAVKTGLANGGSVEVLSGLSDSDPVVVVGQNGLKSGNEVRIIAPAPVTAGRAS